MLNRSAFKKIVLTNLLIAMPIFAFAGGAGPGGGNSLNGKLIEKYKRPRAELPYFSEFFNALDKIDPNLSRECRDTKVQWQSFHQTLEVEFQYSPVLTWYFIPEHLRPLPENVTGIPADSDQDARQNNNGEVWVDSLMYTPDTPKEKYVDLYVHEFVMRHYIANNNRYNFSIDQIEAHTRKWTALILECSGTWKNPAKTEKKKSDAVQINSIKGSFGISVLGADDGLAAEALKYYVAAGAISKPMGTMSSYEIPGATEGTGRIFVNSKPSQFTPKYTWNFTITLDGLRSAILDQPGAQVVVRGLAADALYEGMSKTLKPSGWNARPDGSKIGDTFNGKKITCQKLEVENQVLTDCTLNP